MIPEIYFIETPLDGVFFYLLMKDIYLQFLK